MIEGYADGKYESNRKPRLALLASFIEVPLEQQRLAMALHGSLHS
jgi:hypothetical protein